MMNLLKLQRHEDERVRAFEVGTGHVYFRREKFCARHGWIDLFPIGEDGWQAAHGCCDLKSGDSACAPLPETPRALTDGAAR